MGNRDRQTSRITPTHTQRAYSLLYSVILFYYLITLIWLREYSSYIIQFSDLSWLCSPHTNPLVNCCSLTYLNQIYWDNRILRFLCYSNQFMLSIGVYLKKKMRLIFWFCYNQSSLFCRITQIQSNF